MSSVTLDEFLIQLGDGDRDLGVLRAARAAGYDDGEQELLSVTDAVALAAERGKIVNRNVLTNAARAGNIAGTRVGKSWLLDRASVILWLARYTPYKRKV